MRNTPLLPRPWLSPSTFDGAAHSTCNWQSPNFSFVRIIPDFGTHSIAPSLTIHLVGTPTPSSDSHFDRSLPSNRTIASDGGFPGCATELNVPGVTTAGCGRLPSC